MALLALAPSSADALEQPKHKALSRDACAAVGLPWDFCERVGTEAYNVDSYEWDDLAAHAQVDVDKGQTTCEAANIIGDRVNSLATDLRNGIRARANGEDWATGLWLATQLGRALHTVQDNCAHRGVSNPHHAWLSLSDTCSGTKSSPDTRPEAVTCAQQETEDVIDAFATALSDAGIEFEELDDGVSEGWSHWPERGQVCDFLKSGNAWDGHDDHWNNGVAVPALRDQFAAGVFGTQATTDICGGDANALVATPDPEIDTSKGQSLCLKVRAYCIGKVDAVDEAPPWEDAEEAAADNEGTPPEACSVSGSRPPSAWSLLVVVGAFGVRRRASKRRA